MLLNRIDCAFILNFHVCIRCQDSFPRTVMTTSTSFSANEVEKLKKVDLKRANVQDTAVHHTIMNGP